MLIIPDEVVTGALVNAIAVVGRQISKAVAGVRKSDDVTTARWFETFRLTGTLPDQPDLSPAIQDRLAGILNGDEIQAALQELLAVRLTDAPETDASRARDAIHLALSAAGPDAARFAEALADYYDDQICSLVARLEAKDPPLLAQIRSEAFSARIVSALHAIARHTAALADAERRRTSGQAQAWPQAGDDPAGTLRMQPVGPPAGWLLAEVTDPFALEVHRPVQADDSPLDLPALPAYVPRDHDTELSAVVRAAVGGHSGIAVLVGGSSTGKTRACWEALHLLRDQPGRWRLWHPIDPSRPGAALRELPGIGPRTVVWLNEAQFYLDVADGELGEQVAAGLREVLRDPARAPVLVLATLWPQFWDGLTARPPGGADPHAQARELMAGHDIPVPAAFTSADLQAAIQAGDPRLDAAAKAEDGQVTQFLAGIPELLARYRNAPPAARALIHAAMDARRLGVGPHISLALLGGATPGYLTDSEWSQVGENWLQRALDYAATPCNGLPGILTPVNTSKPRNQRPGHPVTRTAPGPIYRLADYLDQEGQIHRAELIPPVDFWTSVASHAHDTDLVELGIAARYRGLYRDAAQLFKRATAHQATDAARLLVNHMHSVHPADFRPASYAAANADFSDPGAVSSLLDQMRKMKANQQTLVLAERAASETALGDPSGVARMLRSMRDAKADEQATTLLQRGPAACVALNNPGALAELLRELRGSGADDQVRVLLERDLAGHVALEDPPRVGELLKQLHSIGASQQAAALAQRAATDIPLGNTWGIGELLVALRDVGSLDEVAVLARRAAASAPLDHLDGIGWLISRLYVAGVGEQVTPLAERAAAEAPIDNAFGLARVLTGMLEVGATEPIAVLLARNPTAHVSLAKNFQMHQLLSALRDAGAGEQVTALAHRAAVNIPLSDTAGLAELLKGLQDVGATDQIAVLLARNPAMHSVLDDPTTVAMLLDELMAAGAADQVAVLLARNPATQVAFALSPSEAFAQYSPLTLVRSLKKANADSQVPALLERLPGAARFYAFTQASEHPEQFQYGREPDGSAAIPWTWDDLW